MSRGAKSGIFIIAPIEGPVGDRIVELQRRHDPRILKLGPPHVTIAGSSGIGPIDASTPVSELEERLAPIAEDTEPIVLKFGPPTRFMQTKIVVLPLDPHGPLRALHERIKMSGLHAAPPRFFFTPHATISLYREIPKEELAALLAERIADEVVVTRIECHVTKDTGESRRLLALPLGAASSATTFPL